jgi:hypothetical protein
MYCHEKLNRNLYYQVAQAANIPDYSNTLVQLLKSHLLAVCERSWSDPECVQARAGFIVTQQSPFQVASRQLQICFFFLSRKVRQMCQ